LVTKLEHFGWNLGNRWARKLFLLLDNPKLKIIFNGVRTGYIEIQASMDPIDIDKLGS
jgi:hypothetical protein